jgi:catechol 2,3-dioxygenase-like lactoylglutathione lyase family enzyme
MAWPRYEATSTRQGEAQINDGRFFLTTTGFDDPKEIQVTARHEVTFRGIDHVQIAAPAGCEAEARRFFGELLGLRELQKPAALAVRGGLWFQCGAQQLHIGVEKDFHAAKKAHPAFRLADEVSLRALEARLQAAGITTRDDREIEESARFFADDPWGNRLEFVAERRPTTEQ